MSELLLNSLEIKGYRCFEHLTVEKLGRVNLIVGKNNVGKTAFLEALNIYASNRPSQAAYESLENRDEFLSNGEIAPDKDRGFVRNLFYGRPSLEYKSPNALISIKQVSTKDIEELERVVKGFLGEDRAVRVVAHPPGETKQRLTLDDSSRRMLPYFKSLMVSTLSLKNQKMVELWDEVEKNVLEDLVINALKIIDDNLEDIRFSSFSTGSTVRIPVIRLRGANERVPLKSLGEGMNRLLGIALALVNCKDGMLIVDEIESGLHYSILPDVWKLIFKTAKDLNVQVFATTHSKDCVEAFTAAAAESPEDGILIRLERQGEKIVAKTIEEERLELAMAHDVEVR